MAIAIQRVDAESGRSQLERALTAVGDNVNRLKIAMLLQDFANLSHAISTGAEAINTGIGGKTCNQFISILNLGINENNLVSIKHWDYVPGLRMNIKV